MKKKIISVIALLAFLAAALSSLGVCAESLGSGTQRVFDDYDLLSDDEEARLEEAIAYMRGATGMDYVILTTDANTNGLTTADFADDFYDTNGFGSSGILYIIDMAQRNYYFSTAGEMIPYFTDFRVEETLDGAYGHVANGEYYAAFAVMLQYTENYINQGVPQDAWYGDEGSYGYDYYGEGDYYGQRNTGFPSGPVIFGAVVWLIAAWIKNKSVNTSYGMLGSTYSYDVAANTDVEISESRDEYIRTDVVRIPRNTGGGRSGGHSSGSHISTHTSSHGVSHGGGGRHF